ncbi:MAG TPA: ABC transporter permease [Gemmatimonadales bacterium]|jgi:putative ABC transport system permease protein
MASWRQLTAGLRRLLRPAAAERDVRDEVAHYLEQSGGAAIQRTPMEEEVRSYGWENAVSTTLADLRYALRQLKSHPGFTAAAVLTLALGIGANTAAFSVVNGVLLRPLPLKGSDRLYTLYENSAAAGGRLASYPTFLDWREQTRVFGALAFVRGLTVGLKEAEGTENVIGAYVSPGFFDVLTPRRMTGRAFARDEEAEGAHVVVITHRLASRRFGDSAGAIGKSLTLDNGDYRVIGVLPAEYSYPAWADLYVPLQVLAGSDAALTHRDLHVDSRVIGRLAPGMTLAGARTRMNAIQSRLAAAYPADGAGWTAVDLIPLKDEVIGLGPAGDGGQQQRAILVIAAAIGLILLIACANLANLSLARASSRQREMAVRSALGADRHRIVRQLLTESALLSLLGAAAGTLLAVFGVRELRVSMPGALARLDEVTVDGAALAFTMTITLATTVLFGLAPALRAAAPDPTGILKAGSRSVSGRSRFRSALVSIEVALALVLLVGAGLLLRSFWGLSHQDVGFNPRGSLSLGVFPDPSRSRGPDGAASLYRRVEEAVLALPGVATAGLTNNLPLGGGLTSAIVVPGRATPEHRTDVVYFREASPGYFGAMEIPVKQGRVFAAADMTAGARVAVVNEAAVQRYWPGKNPIGQQVTVFRSAQGRADFGQPLTLEIVGVVGDVRNVALETPGQPEIYLPYPVNPWGHMSLVVRTAGSPDALIPALRQAVLATEPGLAGVAGAKGFTPMTEGLTQFLAGRRLTMSLLVSFAGSALLLAVLGIYGVVAYTVAQRTKEIGIRAALGASHGRIAGLVLRQSMVTVLGGLIAGLAAALALTRLLAGLLFGVGPADPATFVAVAALLMLVAILASSLPMLRAMKVDALVALRLES